MTQRTALTVGFSACLVAVLDIFFKYIALTRLPEGGRVSVPIDFILHKNPGIAFNIPIPLSIVILFTIAVLLTIPPYVKRWWETKPERSMAAIVLAIGALGNMIDRMVNGFTTDYILVMGRSVINLSDILIVTGVLMLLWYTDSRSKGRKTE